MSLRITLASFDDDPPIGGQGALVRGMRDALERQGVEVHTVAGHGAHAIPVARITRRAPLDMSLELLRRPAPLLASQPQLIHVMGGPGGLLLLRRMPVPVVYQANHTYRQAHGRGSPRRLLAIAERVAFARAARVLCISESTADAVRRMGVPSDRVEVVHPGVDVDRIERGAAAVDREPGRMLFVGRLEAEKGPLEAVAVMAEVINRLAGARGAVAGTGRLGAEVRAAASAVPQGRIEVLGAVDDSRLAQEYGRASVVLVPSLYEGLGLVALEALVAGAAVCGNDVTGLRDAVGQGGGGLLVPPGDHPGLVAATVGLLTDEPRRAALVAAGRERVLREHSWDTAATRIEAVYRECLQRG